MNGQGLPYHIWQGSFLGGTISPASEGRIDSDVYAHGASEILNAIIGRSGNVGTRGGLIEIGSVPRPARLFGIGAGEPPDWIVALYPGGAKIWSAAPPYSIEAELIANVYFGSGSHTSIPETYLPWSGSELAEVDIAPFMDGAIIVHPKYVPAILRRIGPQSWRAERYVLPPASSAPELRVLAPVPHRFPVLNVVNTSDGSGSWTVTLEPQAVTDQPPLSVAQHGSPTFDNEQNTLYRYRVYFSIANDIQEYPAFRIWWQNQNNPADVRQLNGYVEQVTDHQENTNGGQNWRRWNRIKVKFINRVTGGKPPDLDANKRVIRWDEEVYGPFTRQIADGVYFPDRPLYQFPGAVTIAAGRLWFSGGRLIPNLVAGSSLRSLWDFNIGRAVADDAVVMLLAGDDRPVIRRLAPVGRDLLVSTDSRIWVVSGRDGQIGPDRIVLSQAAAVGCNVRPVQIDEAVCVPDPDAGVVRTISKSGTEGVRDLWAVDDLSIAIAGLLDRVVSIAVADVSGDRDVPVLVVVDASGRAWVAFTNRAMRVAAWSRWESFGPFLEVAAAGRSIVFAIDDQSSARIVVHDPSRWFDRSRVLQRSALFVPALAGKTVALRKGDEFVGLGTVASDGSLPSELVLRLDESAEPDQPIEVGLPFDFRLRLLPPAVQLPNGTMRGRVYRQLKTQCLFSGNAVLSIDGKRADDIRLPPTDDPEPEERRWATSRSRLGVVRVDDDHLASIPSRTVISRVVPAPVKIHGVRRVVALLER